MTVQMFRVPTTYNLTDLQRLLEHGPGPTHFRVSVEVDGDPPRQTEFLIESIESIHGNLDRCLVHGKTEGFGGSRKMHNVALVLYQRTNLSQVSKNFGIIAETSADGVSRFEHMLRALRRTMDEYNRQRKNIDDRESHALLTAVHGPSLASRSFKPGFRHVHIDDADEGMHAFPTPKFQEPKR